MGLEKVDEFVQTNGGNFSEQKWNTKQDTTYVNYPNCVFRSSNEMCAFSLTYSSIFLISQYLFYLN